MKNLITDSGRGLAIGKVIAAALFVLLLSGCNKPTLSGLTPSSGPPGTVVEVNGSDLFAANVKWDAGTPSQINLPSSFLSARFFTVPLTATAGPHPVRLFVGGTDSANTATFTVTTGTVRPQARLDDLSAYNFRIDSGKASLCLMAHAANIDVGSQLRINGTNQPAFFIRVLRNANITPTNASTYGYPIFHYGTVFTVLQNQVPGSDVTVAVVNLDGSVSNTQTYHIAANMDELDSDGDGITDNWETKGYDSGGTHVDLPGLGASPYHKDIFVEVDWMNAAAPNAAIWADIESTFANAPILNSDGTQGIAIHIDRGQAGAGGGGGTIIPFADRLRYDNLTPTAGKSYANMHTIKTGNFNANRLNVYRYCVFGWDNGIKAGSSGQAENLWANDFFVSLGSWTVDGGRRDIQVGTFIHELGHTLNLRHGGFEDANSKENYNSVMQYGNDWIIWMGQNNVYSPSQMSGIDVDCNLLNVDGVFTYSQGMRAELKEDGLNENAGVCDSVARDWNENGTIQNPVSKNLDDNPALKTIKDFADWANIKINFRATGSNWGSD